MDNDKIFVGRKDELNRFKEVLEAKEGLAVLVAGQEGMGKTWLVNKMAQLAKNHPDLKCGCIRYEVTPTDSVNSTMELMMDAAFDAAQLKEGSFSGSDHSLEQWRSFLNVFNLGDLIMSLRRDPHRHTRDQFIEQLNRISEKMPENGRAVFIIDPEKLMQTDSDQAWSLLAKKLPDKIKFIFAQRPEDVLFDSRTFGELENLVRIPQDKRLSALNEEDINELLTHRAPHIKNYSITQLRKKLTLYEGHPYSVQAALDLLQNTGMKLEDLPDDPSGIAKAQFEEICKINENAIILFKAFAVLQVAVPNDVLKHTSALDSNTIQHLLAHKYLAGLIRPETAGKRIYHQLLTDYITGQLDENEKLDYHKRAIEIYRGKLASAKKTQTKPDALSAVRLPEHILQAEGANQFISAFVNECGDALKNLGLFDTFIDLSNRALEFAPENSIEQAMLLGNLGIIYQIRGELDKAEDMHKKSLEIEKKLGRLEGMACSYGNLGIIYRRRGELDKAEDMYNKALKIEEKLGRFEGIATTYSNLGNVYHPRGDLDKAEDMHKKSLEIYKKLGLLEGTARQYGNLGLVYRTHGELDKSEDMHKKSLEIYKKLGLLLGMANQYGNLGNVYRTRGELDKAEQLLKKSLEINEELGRIEGMAISYCALGLVYQARGELDKAENMLNKSLEIDQKLGLLEGMANSYCALGKVYLTRGELDKAEDMHKKSLEIDEELSRPEGIARQYSNLGLVYQARGDLDKAEDMYNKSLEINEKLGRLEGVAKDYANLGIIHKIRGELDRAKQSWLKAKNLYRQIGIPRMVEKIQQWLNGLEDKN